MHLCKKICLSFLSLVIFILLGETGFRLIGFRYYPPDMGFKLTKNYEVFKLDPKKNVYRTKEDVRFGKQVIPVLKKQNEIRIVLVGGSSVAILKTEPLIHLLEKYLGEDIFIRIINFGGVAHGTTRLLLLMPEMLRYKPDLFIFYAGHNEFVENYEKGLYFQPNPLSKIKDFLTHYSKYYQFLSMWIIRGTQLFESSYLNGMLSGRIPPFPPEVKLNLEVNFDKKIVYANYHRNMQNMIKIAKNNNIPCIISTVASNRMRSPSRLANVRDKTFENAMKKYEQGNYSEALILLDEAITRDLNPHRGTKESNRIVKQIAKQYRVPLADVDSAIIAAADHHVPGSDLFVDHCHLNDKGGEIMQYEFFRVIKTYDLLKKFEHIANK